MQTIGRTNQDIKDKNYLPILIGGIITILIAPWLLTTAAHFKWFNFTETGSIGDTIGGITSPIVGTLGAILVYLSFKEQRKANILQWNALEDERLRIEKQNTFEFLYKFYVEEIKGFKFPEGYDLQSCFNQMNGDFDEVEEVFGTYDDIIVLIYNYVNLNLFYLEELKKSNIIFNKKRIIVALYLSNHLKYSSKISLPPQNSRFEKHVEKLFPTFQSSLNNWFDMIDDLRKSEN